jgi:hypothetical protein
MSNFASSAPDVANALARTLSPELTKKAGSKGWTHDIEVEAEGGTLNIAYDEQNENEIFDAEYGGPDRDPQAVIRPFIRKSQETIKHAIEEAAIGYLFDEGILP